MRISRWLLAAVLGVGSVLGSAAAAEVPSPEASFGFTPGADRKLLDYGELIDYLELVAAASPRSSFPRSNVRSRRNSSKRFS